MTLALPGLASAESPVHSASAIVESAMIGNGVVSLGVARDGQIVGLGLGGVFVNNAPHTLGTGWELARTGVPADDGFGTAAVESFATWGTGATSIVRVDDAATGGRFRISHTFRPSATNPNVYEVLVTVENIGTTAMQTDYRRLLGLAGQQPIAAPLSATPSAWHLQPTQDGKDLAFNVGLLMIEPGASNAFRLYYAVSANGADARAALQTAEASVVSESRGALTLAFGYAPGAANAVEDGGTSGGGGGGGGGDGGGSGGSTGGPHAVGGSTPPSNGQPPADSNTPTPPTSGNPPTGQPLPIDPPKDLPLPTDPPKDQPLPSDPPKDLPLPTEPPTELPLPSDPPLNGLLPAVALPTETPELNALTLLGSGLIGMSGYAMARWRSRKQPPSDTTPESD